MEGYVGGHAQGFEFYCGVVDAVVFVEGTGEGLACFGIEFVVCDYI